MTDPAGVVDRLVASREPYLVGVRHHSPALAAVLPALLEEADPQVLAVELPSQARGWLGWLTHPRARAPLALAFSHEGDMAFYPMADFSPELVALRWARDHGVEVDCIDLPVGAAPPEDPGGLKVEDEEGTRSGELGGALWQALARRARARTEDAEEIWDRLVEAHAPGSTPGQVRAAALAHGWAARCRAGRPDALTLAREESMRRRTAHHLAAGRRVAALVGAFHAPALLDVVGHQEAEGTEDPDGVVGCVVAYGFAQLDSRSGYPAGIRDPAWQQLVVDSGLDPERIRQDTTQVVTLVTRGLRDAGHPAGPGEATATARLALDLATLRGLGAPSRRELIEATTSVLAQGEVLGRGRAVASVLEDVLVGDRRGSLAPGTPRAPLRDAVVAELERLGLPVDRPRTLTLAPARGGRELERHVLLHRLLTGGIGYGTCEDPRSWRGARRVTLTWHLAWSAATEAGIELAAPRGLTPEQVATSTLMTRPLPDTPALHRLLTDAAQCASTPALERALDHLAPQVAQVGFTDAVALGGALADVALARVPGAGLLPQDVRRRAGLLRQELTGAALRELAGLSGSDRLEDAAALAAFATEAADHELGLSHALAHLTTHGSPLMQGAASGLLLDAPGQDDLSRRLVSWLSAPTAQARHDLRRRLAGLLVTAAAWRPPPPPGPWWRRSPPWPTPSSSVSCPPCAAASTSWHPRTASASWRTWPTSSARPPHWSSALRTRSPPPATTPGPAAAWPSSGWPTWPSPRPSAGVWCSARSSTGSPPGGGVWPPPWTSSTGAALRTWTPRAWILGAGLPAGAPPSWVRASGARRSRCSSATTPSRRS